MNNQVRIIVLWGLFLFGMVFHSLLALMPLFFGATIAIPDTTGAMPAFMNWLSLAFYLIPMICITVSLYTSAKWHKTINLIIAVLFTLMNISHLFQEIGTGGVQVILLIYIIVISALLTLESSRWLKE